MEDITHLREGSRSRPGLRLWPGAEIRRVRLPEKGGLLADASTEAQPLPHWPKIHCLVRLPPRGVSPAAHWQLPRRLHRRGRSHHCQHGRPGTCLKVRTTERPGICAASALMTGSQSGSQHAQTRSGLRLRLATVTAGRHHVGRREATSGGSRELIWEQDAAGSNPAIPTAIFRMYCQS